MPEGRLETISSLCLEGGGRSPFLRRLLLFSGGYSRRLEMQSASAASAASASSPSARRVSMTPPLAPSASTERMLLASACLPLTATVTRERKPAAVFTNRPAGRACRDTSLGMSTPRSELAGTTYLLDRSRRKSPG